jgi:8-oxo-dGTP pyrophosphatase MutT (NUDIX family)
MYKIYYNEKAICLVHRALESQISIASPDSLKVHYTGKTKFILFCLDKLEKNKDLKTIYILYDDLKRLKLDFFSLFRVVRACGGLVINQKSEMLMIFRRGNWDLPKGKMEPNESKKEAAVREVREETGLVNVALMEKLCTTYHIFVDRSGRRVLKPSFWYLMYSMDTTLIPQTEEDIEIVEWVKLSDYRGQKYLPIYSNITEVIEKYQYDFIRLL